MNYDIVRVIEESAICLNLTPEQQQILCRKAWMYCVNPDLVHAKLNKYWIGTRCNATLKTGINAGGRCEVDALPNRCFCSRHADQATDAELEPLPPIPTKPRVGDRDVVCRPNRFGNICYPNTYFILDKNNHVIAREGPDGSYEELTEEDIEECKFLRLKVKLRSI